MKKAEEAKVAENTPSRLQGTKDFFHSWVRAITESIPSRKSDERNNKQ
jgi:hypothetical protein